MLCQLVTNALNQTRTLRSRFLLEFCYLLRPFARSSPYNKFSTDEHKHISHRRLFTTVPFDLYVQLSNASQQKTKPLEPSHLGNYSKPCQNFRRRSHCDRIRPRWTGRTWVLNKRSWHCLPNFLTLRPLFLVFSTLFNCWYARLVHLGRSNFDLIHIR